MFNSQESDPLSIFDCQCRNINSPPNRDKLIFCDDHQMISDLLTDTFYLSVVPWAFVGPGVVILAVALLIFHRTRMQFILMMTIITIAGCVCQGMIAFLMAVLSQKHSSTIGISFIVSLIINAVFIIALCSMTRWLASYFVYPREISITVNGITHTLTAGRITRSTEVFEYLSDPLVGKNDTITIDGKIQTKSSIHEIIGNTPGYYIHVILSEEPTLMERKMVVSRSED